MPLPEILRDIPPHGIFVALKGIHILLAHVRSNPEAHMEQLPEMQIVGRI